jgi:hypothetical protein
MKNLITAKKIDLANYQLELIEKYKHSAPEDIKAMAGDPQLSAFNGYYALNTSGAFFAIDTNMLIIGNSAPAYFIFLLISLDGKNSKRFFYTGSFDGSLLQQTSDEGLNISLTFTRNDGMEGPTAQCSGTITLPGQKLATPVTGSTYNNPIPASVFGGKYYEPMGTSDIVPPLVLQINDNSNEIQYNEGGGLQPVGAYVYNFNMYYFAAYTAGKEVVLFIMGSAAEGGLACNNINVKSGTSRSLQTIPYPSVTKLVSPNPNSAQLAAFSGYYQLPSIGRRIHIHRR